MDDQQRLQQLAELEKKIYGKNYRLKVVIRAVAMGISWEEIARWIKGGTTLRKKRKPPQSGGPTP